MPQEPKKRHSRQRQGKRRASIKLGLRKTIECPNCHAQIKPHTVCPNCGYYKGRQVIDNSKNKGKGNDKEKTQDQTK